MATAAVRRPSGRVSEVFRTPSKRQGAYDFLEHERVGARDVQRALGHATSRRCRGLAWVYVVVDGTSLSIIERIASQKGFGSIGSRKEGGRGLKVVNALAVTPEGVPLGTLAQIWWARTQPRESRYRPLAKRESRHWHEAVDGAAANLSELTPNTKAHILADREGDAAAFLLKLLGDGHDFTIRSNALRKVSWGDKRLDLRSVLKKQTILGRYYVDVGETRFRPARRAQLHLRALRAPIILRDHITKHSRRAELTVVWAREEGTIPSGQKPLDWVLFTTRPVRNRAEATAIVRGYSLRWRIEDFHRAWKRGHCRVEETQLRSREAVIKWATILAAVASRAEHLRHRARQAPDDPAESEFSPDELQGLLILKEREKRRTETIVPNPTLAQAVRWVADLGGYVGSKSSGAPGTTTIGRGLERVLMAAEILAELRADGKLR